jgi:hypothetical protein
VTRYLWGAGDRAHHGSNRLLVGGWWRLVSVWSSGDVLECLLVVKRRWRIWCRCYWVSHCGRNGRSLSAAGSITSLSGHLIPVQKAPYHVDQQEGEQGDTGEGHEVLEPRQLYQPVGETK